MKFNSRMYKIHAHQIGYIEHRREERRIKKYGKKKRFVTTQDDTITMSRQPGSSEMFGAQRRLGV